MPDEAWSGPRWPDGSPKIMEVRGGATYLSGLWPNSIKVESKNVDGWLHISVTADESICGYAVTVNGRDLPITQPGLSYDELADRAERQSREDGYRFD